MIMIDAFGTIALVAMMPTISIQIVGVMYKIKLSHSQTAIEVIDSEPIVIEELGGSDVEAVEAARPDESATDDIEIIEFDFVGDNSLKS